MRGVLYTIRPTLFVVLVTFLAMFSGLGVSDSFACHSGCSSPLLITPANGSFTNDNTPTFDWTDSTGSPTQYQIQVDNNVDFFSPEIDTISATSTFTSGTLSDGTYSWRVRAGDAANNWSSYSSTFSFTVDTIPPSTATLLTPSNGSATGDNTPSFDWTDVNDAVEYEIQVDEESLFSSPVIDSTSASSSFTSGSVLASSPTTYWWRVVVKDAAGNFGPWSATFSFTLDTVPPTVPVLLSPSNGTSTNDNTPVFDWFDSFGVPAQYQIQVDNSVDFSSPEIDGTTGSSNFTPGTALSDGSYSWRVRASDVFGNWSAYSSVFAFTVDITPPSVPSLITPADTSSTNDNTPTFDWSDSTGSPSQYQIQVDNNADFSSPAIDTTSATSTFTSGIVLADGTYYWRVRAEDSSGNQSSFSSVFSFTVDTNAPSVPVLIAPANGSFTNDTTPAFDWNDSTGSPSQYQIQVDNNADFSSPEIDSTLVDSTFTSGSALPDATYSWRVRAEDSSGNQSSFSSVFSFTVDTIPPSVPVLIAPTNGLLTNDNTPAFDWSDSTGSPSQYRIQIDDNADFSSPEIDATSLDSTFTPDNSLIDGTFYWRVRASDAAGNWSLYSSVRSFTFVAPDQPSLNKTFSPTQIPVEGISTLTIEIANSNSVELTEVAITDNFPAGMTIAETPNATSTCGGTFSPAAGDGSITLSNGAIASEGSCNVTVDVTATSAGDKVNTTEPISSSETGTGGTASATLTVVAPPVIAKGFQPDEIGVNETSSLTITITNPTANTMTLTNVSVTDNLPEGMQVANPPKKTNSCGGTFAPLAGDTTVVLTGGIIPANRSCSVKVDVITTTAGNKMNITDNVSSSEGATGNSAEATLFVDALAQDVAIDPEGRFVVYAGLTSGCTYHVLIFQTLDSGGNPTGSPRQLTACGVVSKDITGIDLLKNGSEDIYWLSFGGTENSDSRFLMKVDVFGNIVSPPTALLASAVVGSSKGATALKEKGCCELVMFTIGAGGSIFRAIIDKATITVSSLSTTSLVAANNTGLQVTQRDQAPQFLSFEKPVDLLKAFGMNSSGLPDRTSWLLCPRTRRGHEVGGVAADGFAALSNYFTSKMRTLYLQRLATNGLPLGDPVAVVSSGIKAVDLTSALSSATRFVVYMTNAGDLMLQVVDATTGAKMGSAIHLN